MTWWNTLQCSRVICAASTQPELRLLNVALLNSFTKYINKVSQRHFAVGRLRLWPAGPGCQTAPRRCRPCRRPRPDRQQWPGSRSSPPWSRWWRPSAWCRWLTAWCDRMSASHKDLPVITKQHARFVHYMQQQKEIIKVELQWSCQFINYSMNRF